MDALSQKKEWILDQERNFARDLACAVIDLPKMNIWMILIPIFLVYHIYRHSNAVKGRSAFAEHYLLSRQRSLEEACSALFHQRPPDIDDLVARAVDLPETARSAYKAWVAELVRHYADLLQAQGADFKSLIQSAYRSRSNYLLLLNQINSLEKALNSALKNHVEESGQSVIDTIARIENYSAELRRRQAETIFP